MSETAQSIPAPVYAGAQIGAGILTTIWSGTARALRFAVREPFFQFLALGFLIWTGAEYIEAHNERYVIHVGSAEKQRLAITYQQQFNQAPTAEQLRALIDRYTKEEIFLREGLALHLDKGDEIVRRRIAQKYEFIQQDLGVADDPEPAALERWFESHKQQYLTPRRVAFAHVYFSSDRDGPAEAYARAQKVLKTLQSAEQTRAPALGDQFPGPSDVGALAPEEAGRLFGESDFSTKLFKLPVGRWSGPFRSGYGWHLVYVTHYQAPVLPSFEEVKAKVLADYQDEQRRLLNAQSYEKLRAKYKVVGDSGQ